MITFVLGIIVAGIAEYFFYNNYIKPEEDMNASALEAELELKNKQINSLKAQLASVSEENEVS